MQCNGYCEEQDNVCVESIADANDISFLILTVRSLSLNNDGFYASFCVSMRVDAGILCPGP